MGLLPYGAEIVTVNVGSITAGTQFIFTPPANYYSMMLSMSATFTTNATVANRYVGMDIEEPSGATTRIFRVRIDLAHAASTTRRYNLGLIIGQPGIPSANPGIYATGFPEHIVTSAGRIVMVADSIQAGDQFTDANYQYARWPVATSKNTWGTGGV